MPKYVCVRALAGYREGVFFSHGQGTEVELPETDEYVRKGFYEAVEKPKKTKKGK